MLGPGSLIKWGDMSIPPDDLDHYDAYGRPILYQYKHSNTELVKLNYAYDKASDLTWRYDEHMQGLGTPV